MATSLALAIPAYNEADGIGGFLAEIDQAFASWDGEVTFNVANDRSTDATLQVLDDLRPRLRAQLRVVTTERNGGHGPTVLRAYREAIATGADVVLQVDGDGQFEVRDIRRVADDLVNASSALCIAKRRMRRDPWFRKILTRCLQLFLQLQTGLRIADPNCPLRAYDRRLLQVLLSHIPDDAAVPNIYLALLPDMADVPITEVIVEHRERRGDAAQGTMWGKRQRKLLIPKRLLLFVRGALSECRSFLRRAREEDLPRKVAAAWPSSNDA